MLALGGGANNYFSVFEILLTSTPESATNCKLYLSNLICGRIFKFVAMITICRQSQL